MFDLFYLHKAKKCLLIPVKQYVGVAWKTLGIKKNNNPRSPVAPVSLKIFELCASSERHPSCWELELENGELGLIFGSAFHSLYTLGKPHVAVGPVLSPMLCVISSDCTFLR